MSKRQVVHSDSNPEEILEEAGDITIERVFDFGNAGYAAVVEAHDDNDLHVYAGIKEVQPADIQFQRRTMPNTQDVAVADETDVETLHNFNDNEPLGDNITIVATDSGVDTSHPIFDGKDVGFYDTTGFGEGDPDGHGTAVLGLISQFAPNADLEMVRIFGAADEGAYYEDILEMYEYVLNNSERIDVVNMSWGYQEKVQSIDDLQNELVISGVRPVTAAGNTGEEGGSPATAELSFGIGACDADGDLAEFSSYNPDYDNPDVTAIGVNNRLAAAEGGIMGTPLEENYVKASGTSFAAPIVAAAVGRYLNVKAMDETITTFENTANNIVGTPEEGAGLLDYAAAVEIEEEEDEEENTDEEEDENTDEEEEQEPEDNLSTIEEADASVWTLWGNNRDMVFIDADWMDSDSYTAKLQKDDESGITVRFEERDEGGN